jgi:minor extracellular protease Epr
VDGRLRVYRYANRGDYIMVAARGVDVAAAAPGGIVTGHTGTSFAAPVVAAHLARCIEEMAAASSACVAKLGGEARDLGVPGRDTTYGFGLIE